MTDKKDFEPFNPAAGFGSISNSDLLNEKALTVRLFRKTIPRNKMDKDISTDLRKRMNVGDDVSLRVNKSIFTKANTDPFMKIKSEAGKYFYRTTCPWDDKGFRLLSIELYKDFVKVMKEYTRKFREAVESFLDGIDNDIETMREVLGDAFNRNDYNDLFLSNGKLDREKIREGFMFELEFGTVSDANDIRANLTEDDREIIADHITKKNTEKFAASQKHIIVTLHEHIMKIHERLCQNENVFRDTLIGNLRDLCDLIPKLNIAGDPALNLLAAEAKEALCKWEPQVLRDDEEKRAEVAAKADEILGNMKGLI
jgi:hypothetical protein